MQNKLESRLSQLEAPQAPCDLKARCQRTIPADARLRTAKARGFGRPLSAPKLGLATLVIVTAVACAFWNTRPVANNTAHTGGNVAFAQTVEAMKNVTYARISGWSLDGEGGWFSKKQMKIEGDIDLSRGVYMEQTLFSALKDESKLPTGNSLADRTLVLPDGTVYNRAPNSASLLIENYPKVWQTMSKSYLDLAVRQNYSFTKTATIPKLISSEPGEWQDKTANVYIFRAAWSAEMGGSGDDKGPTWVETRFFVDPQSELVRAEQSFVILKDGTELQQEQIELDYTRPDAAVFDPATLEVGAKITGNRKHQ